MDSETTNLENLSLVTCTCYEGVAKENDAVLYDNYDREHNDRLNRLPSTKLWDSNYVYDFMLRNEENSSLDILPTDGGRKNSHERNFLQTDWKFIAKDEPIVGNRMRLSDSLLAAPSPP